MPGGIDYEFESVETEGTCFSDFARPDQDELNVRHQRMLARRTKAADFRTLKTLEDFDWQFNPTGSGA